MSAESATLAGRAAAERLMVDTCTITRLVSMVTDGETGRVTPTFAVIYSGKCRVQQRASAGSRADVGQASVVEVSYGLQVPMSVTGVQTEDRVTITASSLDAALPGRVFHIGGPAAKTHGTARRMQLIEVTS